MVNKEDMDTVISSVLSDTHLIELIKRRVLSVINDPAFSTHAHYDKIIASTIDHTFQELGIGEMVAEYFKSRRMSRQRAHRERDIAKPSYSYSEPGQVNRPRGKRRTRVKSDDSADFHLVSSTGDNFDPSRTQTLSRSGLHGYRLGEAKTPPEKDKPLHIPPSNKDTAVDESGCSSPSAEDAAAAHMEGHLLEGEGEGEGDSLSGVQEEPLGGLSAGMALYESLSEEEINHAAGSAVECDLVEDDLLLGQGSEGESEGGSEWEETDQLVNHLGVEPIEELGSAVGQDGGGSGGSAEGTAGDSLGGASGDMDEEQKHPNEAFPAITPPSIPAEEPLLDSPATDDDDAAEGWTGGEEEEEEGLDYSLNDFEQPSMSTASPRHGGDDGSASSGRSLDLGEGDAAHQDDDSGDSHDDDERAAMTYDDEGEWGPAGGDIGGGRRVQFSQSVVSDTFYHRLKYAPEEVVDLFYTHEEAMQFQYDYDREATKAEAEGREWTEYVYVSLAARILVVCMNRLM